MVFGGLNTQQILERANFHMDNARKTKDPKLALVLCEDADSALSYVRRSAKWVRKYSHDESLRTRIAATCFKLSTLQGDLKLRDKAQDSYRTAEKWGWNDHAQETEQTSDSNNDGVQAPFLRTSDLDCDGHSVQSVQGTLTSVGAIPVGQLPFPSTRVTQDDSSAVYTIPSDDMRSPTKTFKLPKPFESLNDTPQLVYCLSLLGASQWPVEALEPDVSKWLRETRGTKEHSRLNSLAKDVIREFLRDEFKDANVVAEVVHLAPVLENEEFRCLFKEFYSGIDQSGLLDVHQLEGLAQVIQNASPDFLDADDLVNTLKLLSIRLRSTHQSSDHMLTLTLAVSNVLDAMADTKVKGLDRETLHEPLLTYLNELQGSTDPYMVYQSAYAFQALQYVPDNETLWQATLRRGGKVIQGVAGLAGAVMSFNLKDFIEGLENIQEGAAGVSGVFKATKDAYNGVMSLYSSGSNFLDCLNQDLSFSRKKAWYPALRGIDILIQDGRFDMIKEMIQKIRNLPCRSDPAFQWGVCQRLGEIAANSKLNPATCQDAIDLLGDVYRDDEEWGQNISVKQWVLKILMQLASLSVHAAETLLQELETSGDTDKQGLYQACRDEGAISHPLMITLPQPGSPSLLDHAQNRPDVEHNLGLLREKRTKEGGRPVYIEPQAKASLQASDDSGLPLMEKVEKFLQNSQQPVFLLMGDSGAGKSTFNQELEYKLWLEYKAGDRIPLHINLPTIDKPEHDMIAKHLRKLGFTEPQIRELKAHRSFILICDGYDESQQKNNLYAKNRLNETGEWIAQMVISCRSEYLGIDYRNLFQPLDRNCLTEQAALQEAVITSFSEDQIQKYIKQFVRVTKPHWKMKDYQDALNLIPGLNELVKNPFMLSLSLDVLPRMVDPGQNLSATRITRVALYDHFIDHWLERGKRRIEGKALSPQARAAFDSLNDEGFTKNSISFLKRLAMAIYREQDGHPIVDYLRYKDQDSWKAVFFGQGDEKLLLREACPLARKGSQYRFIHRSLLEYGLARAVFDPFEVGKKTTTESEKARRGSVSSIMSFEIQGDFKEPGAAEQPTEDLTSPLVTRSFVNERSLLHFLQERALQEPVFMRQLRDYIERSKAEKKWRTAAANAITILVRAGVQFNGDDLRGIQIPGADLSYGVFDSAQFQGADLRKVNLHNAWLRQASLWRTRMSGARFGEFLAEDSKVLTCAHSPIENSVAAGLESGNIAVYSVTTWKRLHLLSGHTSRVTSVVYLPKGDRIASGSGDKTVRLWELDSGTCIHNLSGHAGEVTSIVHSPRTSAIASGSSDGTIRLWNTETGDCTKTLTLNDHGVRVTSVAYSPGAEFLVSGSSDGIIRLWNPQTGACLKTLSGHEGEVTCVGYLLGEVVSGGKDKTLKLWDTDKGTCRHTLAGHGDRVTSISCSPKGDMIASSSEDKTMRLWNAKTMTCHRVISGHPNRVSSVVYTLKGNKIASSSWDMTVRLWDVEVGASDLSLGRYDKRVSSAVVSSNGDVIVTGGYDGTLRFWDTTTRNLRDTLGGPNGEVTSIVFSPKGDLIVSNCIDHTVHLWNLGTRDRHKTFSDQCVKVGSVAFSPDGDVIVTGNIDHSVQLWNVATGASLKVLEGHTSTVTSVRFSPSGDVVASGSVDNTTRLWDVETGSCRHVLTGHEGSITDIVFSPNGALVASGSKDKTVRQWDTNSGSYIQVFTGHSDTVLSVGYSQSGELIASGSNDKTIRLWEVASGRDRGVIQCFGKVVRVAWSSVPDANSFITVCDDGSMRLWKVTEEGDQCRISMQWSSAHDVLTLAEATIRDVQGLGRANAHLLKQHGAIGEPAQDATTQGFVDKTCPPSISIILSSSCT